MSQLFDAITNLSDDIVEEARTTPLRRPTRSPWLKYTAVAACATFAVGLGGLALLHGGLGGASSGEGGGGNTAGTDGGATSFMSYAGPIFPMTLATENPAITATRDILLDFAPYIPTEHVRTDRDGNAISDWYGNSQLDVTDSYTLSNASDSDQTVTLRYPVVGDLRSSQDILPTVTVDGEAVDTTLHFGSYSGGFVGLPGEEERGLYNLEYLSHWTGYRELLEDGQYEATAFAEAPTLSRSVIVYKFTNHTADFSEGVNPTLGLFYDMDYDKTMTLSHGFNGGSYDQEGGTQSRHYSIPAPDERGYDEPRYLIALGDDIQNLTMQGYENGGCNPGEEIPSVSATMERYETTLGELLTSLGSLNYQNWQDNGEDDLFDCVSQETYTDLCVQLLCSYGALSQDLIARYDNGMLEDIFSEAGTMDRVIYSQFTVTISAGSSVDVTAQLVKERSFDYYQGGEGSDMRHGYDMVTQVGSNLALTTQTASVDTHDVVEIVNQNFGFDVPNDITKVTLDSAVEHYYLEVLQVKS